ncbi:MAG: hypothetical protein V2J19_05755 [Wenzhouxiangella sp.]|jgi:hypothetical protein|nr:hypothetical protein [Wenzhouxiangella sp.]
MNRLKTVIKWGFLALLVLLVVLAIAWAISRSMYPTGEQREAIAAMEQQPDPEGENAFPLLWMIDRDVPFDEIDAVMAEDVERASAIPPVPGPDDDDLSTFVSAARDYPDLSPKGADREMFCRGRGETCLDRVRGDLDAYAALIDRHDELLERIGRLHEYNYVRSELPHKLGMLNPNYQSVFLPRTRHALRFAQGNTNQALAATCREIATWRRLGANADNLITRLIGAEAATDQYGHTLANMLSELPADTPLPESCEEALVAPGIDDLSLCRALRSDFGIMASVSRHLPETASEGGLFEKLAWSMFYDGEATLGATAESYHSMCGPAERERLLADRRDRPEPAPRDMWRFACVGNPIGCMVNGAAQNPVFTGYRHRLQDYGAKLRVLGTLAWIRRHADEGRSPEELLAARPDELKSPARDIDFGPEGQSLRVPLYDTTRGEHWSVPLPPELHRSTGSS